MGQRGSVTAGHSLTLTLACVAAVSGCDAPTRGERYAGGGAFIGADPAMTPDGQHILFASPHDGLGDIYIMSVAGSEPRRLTSAPEYDGELSLSRDGSRIAFVSERDGPGDIYTMNVDGSGVVRVTDLAAADKHPSFSPDGTQIVFQRNNQIFIMDSDGHGARPLTDQGMYGWPSFSPDGTRIVYQAVDYDKEHRVAVDSVWIMDEDGTDRRLLQLDAGSPAFSPDGKTIVFASDRAKEYDSEIYVMNADGSNVTQVTGKGGMKDAPKFTPDGSRILFVQDGPGGRSARVRVIGREGSGLATIARIY